MHHRNWSESVSGSIHGISGALACVCSDPEEFDTCLLGLATPNELPGARWPRREGNWLMSAVVYFCQVVRSRVVNILRLSRSMTRLAAFRMGPDALSIGNADADQSDPGWGITRGKTLDQAFIKFVIDRDLDFTKMPGIRPAFSALMVRCPVYHNCRLKRLFRPQ
jgi:hypothetical protein